MKDQPGTHVTRIDWKKKYQRLLQSVSDARLVMGNNTVSVEGRLRAADVILGYGLAEQWE